MAVPALPDLYQLRIRLCGVSPLIWRRLLVRSDTSIAELHNLHRTFERWYPTMTETDVPLQRAA